MSAITVTRQFGAGGSPVARLAATRLGWTLVDNEFVDAVAERAGLPAETVAAHEERAPSLMERLIRSLATVSPEVFIPAASATQEPDEAEILAVTQRVIADAATLGRVVLVGRGAQAYLATARPEHALHVLVVAPRPARIAAVAERLGVDAVTAERTMDATDADRDRYVHRHYGRTRLDPSAYHLVVNTGWLGYDGAAHVLVTAARQRGWGDAETARP